MRGEHVTGNGIILSNKLHFWTGGGGGGHENNNYKCLNEIIISRGGGELEWYYI